MRFFTFLITISAIAISANANNITQKREVSFAFKTCDKSVADATRQLQSINRKARILRDFSAPEDELIRSFHVADEYCCERFVPIMSSEDADAVLSPLSSIVGVYDNLVSTFINRKQKFASDKKGNKSAAFIIRNTSLYVNSLSKCLISKPLANYNPAEAALFDKLDKADSKAKAAFNI